MVAQSVKRQPALQKDLGSIPGSGRFPWRRKRQSTPVFLPGKLHGQRSLGGYGPWGLDLATKTRPRIKGDVNIA